MKKLVKLMCLIVALAMVSSFSLAGCNSGDGDKSSTSDGTAGNTDNIDWTYKGDLPAATLNYVMMQPNQSDEKIVYEYANKIIKKEINAEVKFIPIDPGVYAQKVMLMLNGNENIDLMFAAHWVDPYYQKSASEGVFAQIDELLPKYAPKTKEFVQDRFWEATKVDGKMYGVINFQRLFKQTAMWFVKDLADLYKSETGEDVSKYTKASDMDPFMQWVKDKHPEYPIILDINKAFSCLDTFTGDLGAYWVALGFYADINDLSKVSNSFDMPKAMDIFRMMYRWNQKGFIRKDAAIVNTSEEEQKAKKVACGFDKSYSPVAPIERFMQYQYERIYVPITEPLINSQEITATLTCIKESSKNKERAMMLIELLNTNKELYNTLLYGVKDKHYKITGTIPNGETRIELLPDSNKYKNLFAWSYGNSAKRYLTPQMPDNLNELTLELTNQAQVSPITGFNFKTKTVRRQFAAVDSVTKEKFNDIGLGFVDPDVEVPKLREKMKKAGSDELDAEFARQYTEFMKQKGIIK